MKKKTIKDVDLKGKRLLIRVDFNVPLDECQHITDDRRIWESLPTIRYAMDHGARVILISHLGRPKGKVIPEMSLKPVARRLGELLGKPVGFVSDCIGTEVENRVNTLSDGDVLLLENVRFHKEETENDPDFSQKLARLADVFVNDAFGCAHRVHASCVGVTDYLKPCVSGLLMEKELNYLGKAVCNPERPFITILGGMKVEDKISVIQYLDSKVDRLIIGGGMMFTFLRAQGKEIGKSLLDESSLDFVRGLLNKSSGKIVLPVDCIVSDMFHFKERQIGKIRVVSVDNIPEGWMGLDIGPKSIELFSSVCRNAKTIVWNGPMGVFEIKKTSKGTTAIAHLLAELTRNGTTTIVGGGDSASAVKNAGVADALSHVSTGGGASLEFLEGKVLPGLSVLTNA